MDIFTRSVYADIVVDSLAHCIKNKGLRLNAWVIMSNHIHLMMRSDTHSLSDILRDFKGYTSKRIVDEVKGNPSESRRRWMLEIFSRAGAKNPNNQHYQIWQQHNHPMELDSAGIIDQKADYIHNNPVKAGLVDFPENWRYSSAPAYAGQPALLDLEFIDG